MPESIRQEEYHVLNLNITLSSYINVIENSLVLTSIVATPSLGEKIFRFSAGVQHSTASTEKTVNLRLFFSLFTS